MATQSLRRPRCNLSRGVQFEVTQGHTPSPGTCNGPALELAWSRPDLKLVWGQLETACSRPGIDRCWSWHPCPFQMEPWGKGGVS